MPKKILLIDDELTLGEILANRLRAHQYEIVIAVSGGEGLEKAKNEKPDLILLGMMMPDMDGYRALCQLKAGTETRKIPVVMLTVKEWGEDIRKSLAGGAVDYLVKPFNAAALLEKIRGALKDGKKNINRG